MSPQRLHSAFSQLDLTKKDQDYLIPALLGFPLNGSRAVDVPGRAGYVYARVRSNLNEVVQVFNDKVTAVYDLPVLLIRDPNNPTRYKVDGRDLNRYMNWGSQSSYLPKHGSSHSFSPSQSLGGDVVWVYSQQIVPWNVAPSGSFGGPGVYINGHSTFANGDWAFWGGTGTPSLVASLPSGSFARMILISLNSIGNPVVTPGDPFAITATGTSFLLSHIPDLPTSNIPLAAVYLASGTSTIQWEHIHDLRPFFTGAGSSSATGTVTSSDITGLNINLIRVWDTSAGVFVTYPATTTGLTNAVGNSESEDIVYLPPVNFDDVELTISTDITIIGASRIRGSLGTRLSNSSANPVITLNSTNVQIEHLYINTLNFSGGCTGIDVASNSPVLINVDVFAFGIGGTALALKDCADAFCLGCIFAANTDGTYTQFPFNTAPCGIYDVNDPSADYPTTTVRSRNLRIGNNDTSYMDLGVSGTMSFAGAGGIRVPCVTGTFSIPPTASQIASKFGTPGGAGMGFLTMINVSGTNDYLVASNGYNWFYSAMTKAV